MRDAAAHFIQNLLERGLMNATAVKQSTSIVAAMFSCTVYTTPLQVRFHSFDGVTQKCAVRYNNAELISAVRL